MQENAYICGSFHSIRSPEGHQNKRNIPMCLGDGQNLADTLRLTYDELYYATHGKLLRFLRHKTRERNESASEVIFPVTPEIQEILNRYGNTPKLGRRVFPIMSDLITPE